MPYDPDIHHRRSIRLAGFDYSTPGAYFITLCTQDRECIFGQPDGDTIRLNALGQIVEEEWHRSGEIRHELELDAWVVMPNHVHGIVVIAQHENRGARPHAPALTRRPKSLSTFVIGFKSATKTRINDLCDSPGKLLWQRNYYDRIIRNERELNAVREYIFLNPVRWALDDNNPAHGR